eukprot:scaffold19862_cov58-Phaeocystis_antarctica.AAC.4
MAHPVSVRVATILSRRVVGESAEPRLPRRADVVCHAVAVLLTPVDKDSQLRGAIPEHVEKEALLEIPAINVLPPIAKAGVLTQQRA